MLKNETFRASSKLPSPPTHFKLALLTKTQVFGHGIRESEVDLNCKLSAAWRSFQTKIHSASPQKVYQQTRQPESFDRLWNFIPAGLKFADLLGGVYTSKNSMGVGISRWNFFNFSMDRMWIQITVLHYTGWFTENGTLHVHGIRDAG